MSLADITTVDGHRVMHQAFETHCSHGLRNNIIWPRSPDVLPRSSINLWKLALEKCFFDPYSGINRRLPVGLNLDGWIDQIMATKWIWWKSIDENRLYRRTEDGCNIYTQQIGNRYAYHHSTDYFPAPEVIPVSIKVDHANIRVEMVAQPFNPTPPPYAQLEFEDDTE